MKDKAVVLLSGGVDSTTLACYLAEQGHEIHALSILYGQRHSREVNKAKATAIARGWEHHTVNLANSGFLFGQTALTGEPTFFGHDVPEGHYTDESMKATVVPNRNMVLLSLATAYAISIGARSVAYAAHAGDHAIYPDCRPEFVLSMAGVIAFCDEDPPILAAPFLRNTKAEIVKLGASLPEPVDYSLTWSCYVGGAKHCGRCGTCVERKEAFELAGVVDPTEYDDSD